MTGSHLLSSFLELQTLLRTKTPVGRRGQEAKEEGEEVDRVRQGGVGKERQLPVLSTHTFLIAAEPLRRQTASPGGKRTFAQHLGSFYFRR